MQIELIRFRKKDRLCLRLRIEEYNAISLTEPNSRDFQLPDSVYRRIQLGVRNPARCEFGHSIGVLSLVNQLIYEY